MDDKRKGYKVKAALAKLTEKQRKDLLTITLLFIGLLFLLLLRNPESGSYVVNQKGEVTTIVRNEESKSGEYHVLAELYGEGGREEKEIEIVLDPPSSEKEAKDVDSDEREDQSAWLLEQVIAEIEASEAMSVKLPSALEDGTKVRWHLVKERDYTPLALAVGYFLLIPVLLQNGRYERKKAEAATRNEILADLPRFTNQLLLMMNAGLILKDALEHIAGCYERKGERDLSLLEREVCAMVKKDGWEKQSAATHFTELARKYSVKELMRLATILRENERKGINIIEPLERESEYLFEHRKLMGKEQGKRIDLKMSYPLACLLFLLIVITMAPTMLSL